MTPAARLAAAIDVLHTLETGRGHADETLKAWGKAHRFAGSGDRRAISERVYAVLRARSRIAWRMQADDARSLVLGSLVLVDEVAPADAASLFSGEGHAPAPLTPDEAARLHADPALPPEAVEAGVPAFVAEVLKVQFGDAWLEEAQTLTGQRAPVDLRVNSLRGSVDAALRLLAVDGLEPEATPFSRLGLRLPPARATDVQSTRAFQTGWIEVQDEASQIAAALCGAKPGDVVIDWCAGGGGKTLALAAQMQSPFPLDGGRAGDGAVGTASDDRARAPPSLEGFSSSNGLAAAADAPAPPEPSFTPPATTPIPGPSPIEGEGRLLALDVDAKRLAAIGPRLTRAGADAEIRKLHFAYANDGAPADLPEADVVFVDAPCSGSGTWRRHPEGAHRLTEETVARLAALQAKIVAAASQTVKVGGRLAYATCSVLPQENADVARTFLAAHPHFRPVPIAQAVANDRLTEAARERLPALAGPEPHMLQMTPRRTGTDGFFIALFERIA